MELSVVIPAYNEVKRLSRTIPLLLEYFGQKNVVYEILIIDDGSTDSTADLVRSFSAKPSAQLCLYRNKINYGKGYSVKKGVMQARGRHILVIDADNSTPIHFFEKLMKQVSAGYDVVIGSRALKESNIILHQRGHRELMGKVFNLLVRFFMRLPYRDTQCGFKLFKEGAAKSIFRQLNVKGFAFDVEVLVLAHRQGQHVLEFPVEWSDSRITKVKVAKHSFEMFFDLLKIFFQYKIVKRFSRREAHVL